jgi:hypothetical protein
MIRIEKTFAYGYAKPVNRGVFLWDGDREDLEGPSYWLDHLVYEALGEEVFWSSGYELGGITVTIEVSKATRR